MLDLEYLMYQGEIKSKVGLLVTWYHAANSKSEMEEALNSMYLLYFLGFLKFVQNKFPDVTLSPGWVTLYLPPIISNRTYTREMIQQMYDLLKDLPQKITYPAQAVMTRSAWSHFNWLLQQSDRLGIPALWQGKSDPLTLEDLLFIRDSSNPEKIYYDIFEPLLSEFKQAALNTNRKRLFYPEGSIQLYFQPEDFDGLLVNWYEADISSEKEFFSSNSGMVTLKISVQDSSSFPQVAFPKSPTQFPLELEDYMNIILASPNPWGVFLKTENQDALNKTLNVLSRIYDRKALNVPVWISMEVSYGNFSMEAYIQGKDFLNTINDIFPYVTIAPSWPAPVLDSGYTEILVQDMLMLCEGLWQEVSFQLNTVALGKEWLSSVKLLQASPTNTTQNKGYTGFMAMRSHEENRIYYRLQQDYRDMFLANVFTS
ncbi:hypothetical protein XELAEV_18023213mg [Xenopus laevis]|uniref:Protein FAM151A n=1 Tax=Xenopus laevis TaxID=8355 RepID=A0A974D6L9_XENLA|nr:hypothetical protein XELAEV_18023213mg [Xenopus laevis]